MSDQPPAAGTQPPAAPPPGTQPPSAPPAGAPPAPKTIADGAAPPAADTPPAPAADWATLRGDWASGDEATSKVLSRYADGRAFVKAHKELVDKVASGDLRSVKPLPKDATPEQLAEYRKANGVPEQPDGYEIQFPVGFTPDDATKATLEEYRAFAHSAHLPAEVVKGNVAWYLAAQQQAMEKMALADDEHQQKGTEQLRKDWGHEFRQNLQTLQTLFEGNEELFASVMAARGPDGRKLGNNPDVLRFLVNIGVQANPSIREYAGDGSVTPSGAMERVKEIEDLMVKDFVEYKDPAIQAEYSRLLSYLEARGQKVA